MICCEWIQAYIANAFAAFTPFTSPSSLENYRFIYGETWLSTWQEVIVIVGLYLLAIKLIRQYTQKNGAWDLRWLVIAHNTLMCIFSAILFFALSVELWYMFAREGIWSVFCDAEQKHTKGKAYFYYFLNYFFKYLELFDTILLALRNKPIPFLHWYHHSATLILCWSQLVGQSCIQWLPIIINLFIHIIMYAYYALVGMRIEIWWKKYLTTLQIIQFVVGLSGCVFILGSKCSVSLGLLPASYFCHGHYYGAFFGVFIIASYLLLFIDLFQEKYKHIKTKGQKSE